ncbi:hypothetical protein SCUCBS95973_009327 [Sporothrix curviconia]|uniref:Uncharacterized protein n=1 Tax=Sporothrix curviconia TaxID=1260050 RepID=A0ABP0CU04_9PEZI
MEPLGQISIPTLVAQPASRCPEVKMGGCDASPQVQHVSSTAPEVEMAQNSGKGVKVSEDVLKVIKINKMGKSVIWNYMTEEPAIREPSAEELEEMKPLPPPDNTRWSMRG